MSDNSKHRAAIYHDKAVIEKLTEDLQVMAEAVLSGRKLTIEYSEEGFDMYPSCKNLEKKYCHCKSKKYQGYISPGGYMVFADSKIGIYCKVIEIFAGNQINIPFTRFREKE